MLELKTFLQVVWVFSLKSFHKKFLSCFIMIFFQSCFKFVFKFERKFHAIIKVHSCIENSINFQFQVCLFFLLSKRVEYFLELSISAGLSVLTKQQLNYNTRSN